MGFGMHVLHEIVGVHEHSLTWNAESICMGNSMVLIASSLSMEERIATIAFEFGFFFLAGAGRLVLVRCRVVYVLIVAVFVHKRTIARVAIVTHVIYLNLGVVKIFKQVYLFR